MKKYDIIVAGGGLSGVAAAVSAAKQGAKVLIVEQYGFLGGMAGSALVNPFMSYWLYKKRWVEDNHEKIVNSGIFGEIIEGLRRLGGLHKDEKVFNEEILKIVLDNLVSENGVDVLFHSFLHQAEQKEGRVLSVSVVNKQGEQKLEADYFIDATGDADLSALCGCECRVGREEDGLCSPMTLCFNIINVDYDKVDPKEIHQKYKEAQKAGKIKNPREDVLRFRHMADNVMHLNSTRVLGTTPMDAEGFSKAEMEGRKQMYELFCFLKENCKGFENIQLLMSGAQIGVRESRRIVGEYTLTAEDVLQAVKFDDSVARGNYPIDIHNPSGTGTLLEDVPYGNYYTIPYRCLLPVGMKNLIVAGRPISSTHEAHASHRVMPISACVGHGAGAAAGLAVHHKCDFSNVDIEQLHQVLDAQGGLY